MWGRLAPCVWEDGQCISQGATLEAVIFMALVRIRRKLSATYIVLVLVSPT